MFCPQCGASGDETHQYCHACGAAMPRETRRVMAPPRTTRALNPLGDPGVRLFAYAIGGLVGVFVLAELVRAVVLVAIPLLVVLALLYWARERRGRYN